MQKISLEAMVRTQLAAAADSGNGRAARTVFGGHEHRLRQTLIALRAGASLADHESPGEATLLVLHGRVRLTAGDDSWDGRRGDLLIIPPAVHRLDAVDDAAVVLTVVMPRG